MGDNLVSGLFPDKKETEGGEGQKDGSAAHLSYTDIFYKHLPFYLSIGMTYDQFWYGDCTLVKYYRQAFEMQQDRENQKMWMQGRYVYDALCEAAPLFRFSMKGGRIEPMPYTEEPYPRTEKQFEERKRRDEKAHMEKLKADLEAKALAFNKQFEQKQKEQEVTDDG